MKAAGDPSDGLPFKAGPKSVAERMRAYRLPQVTRHRTDIKPFHKGERQSLSKPFRLSAIQTVNGCQRLWRSTDTRNARRILG
jgi:hypothetical protein